LRSASSTAETRSRVERLRAREHASYTDQHIWDFILFAAWQRLHRADPRWMPEVITGHWSLMKWDRWASWTSGDPRWNVPTFDTSDEAIADSAKRVASWAREQVRLRDENAFRFNGVDGKPMLACASVRECHPTSKRFCDPDRADGSKRDAVDAKARSHSLD
jgi:hypothetical protein